ncbi:hypothetical protein [Streptomyces violaceus]|uniref:Ribbon-helix-helix protein CopG domain-containing protein n=1 Tax=Streptomyces violaceus TaxID=1936 RepID=A0ABY9UTI4_STRVL|nr:hypothetical protein [Streptomyces janthinus]WND23601.1 hypothetical protein RI060_42560 [Streptomyces janthinus]GGS95546.1 hypothetical protein GCM10010270_79390 [Streptomyces janthinus]
MPHHALEITLTRPLSAAELHHAAQAWPLAANHNTTRLMALVGAKTPERAAHRLRRRLTARLPIDVITTHYADAHGQVLLNLALPPATHTALARDARHAGLTPERYVREALQRALAAHADQEAERLDHAVRHLLAHTSPAHLLSAVGHALITHPLEGPTP